MIDYWMVKDDFKKQWMEKLQRGKTSSTISITRTSWKYNTRSFIRLKSTEKYRVPQEFLNKEEHKCLKYLSAESFFNYDEKCRRGLYQSLDPKGRCWINTQLQQRKTMPVVDGESQSNFLKNKCIK